MSKKGKEVPVKTLRVKLENWVPVNSVREASIAVNEWRGIAWSARSGTEFYEIERAGEVVENASGKTIARISYNGQAWNPGAENVRYSGEWS